MPPEAAAAMEKEEVAVAMGHGRADLGSVMGKPPLGELQRVSVYFHERTAC